MPLKLGSSPNTVSNNIRELHSGNTYASTEAKYGKARADKQAVAIAMNTARKGRAVGGPVAGLMQGNGVAGAFGQPSGLGFACGGEVEGRAAGGFNMAKSPSLTPGSAQKQSMHNLTKGAILSSVPGRTDRHYTHVPSGSYVIPADIVSGRGEGNTLAGASALSRLFKIGPYGGGSMPVKHGPGAPRAAFPKMSKVGRKRGGADGNPDHMGIPVRVNLAGGEIVVPPENLLDVVHPHLKTAHKIMDAWVLKERKKLRKTLAKLPGPVKD